ncbi:uncharacterized protein EI97DRAFT_460124 [Westerdykella ornata]|uniref:RSC complex subunit Rsc7 n=1 Tax=Westerdykella ornata TaxID=318751 RepID=A0A6A6JH42_WESOR|nr:uncharacterized protein EI97DRAFT_460124 [Westerdykella ornata]KAF2274549.1 hypothetical protein EI97DRAFT_460124 [Westerdykella ornata]
MHPVQALSSNASIGNGIMDPSGTINPAALNSAAGFAGSPSQQAVATQSSRGVKRSRSPDGYGESQADHDEHGKSRKRVRPKGHDSPARNSHLPPTPSSQTSAAPPVQTPQLPNASIPHASPPQLSSSKPTPTKPSVIKALPTVRDHTTDQLNPEGDEYIPREIDEAGETKVTATGHPLGGREYRCRTFFVPNRGDKLFMLATECARVLGYRDSYLLFNKNRSLYKIIATQAEKDDLIHQEILPYSYRSRQIAIVTARSMFRQFGSKLIVNGRRVRDDYWESKARKQGFTEEDAAGEKRPGAAKAREAAAAEANHATAQAFTFTQPSPYTGKLEQDYLGAAANPHQPFGGINPAPGAVPTGNAEPFNQRPTTDLQPRDYSGVQRGRQDLSGMPYQDMTRPTNAGEILNQAAQAADLNKQITQQRKHRKEYLESVWARPHEPSPQPQRPVTVEGESAPQVTTQAVQSPHIPPSNPAATPTQYGVVSGTPQRGQAMAPQPYRQQSLPQSSMVPSPLAPQHTPLRPDQMQRRPPSMGMLPQGMPQGMPSSAMLPNIAHGQAPAHGYAPSHMWPQGPPQPSPLSQQHNMQPQYAQRPPQQSPLPQPSPMHASAQLHQPQSTGSMHGTPVQQYQTMAAMDPGYQAMSQNTYPQTASPQQFMPHQSNPTPQPGMSGWTQAPQGPQQGWQTY